MTDTDNDKARPSRDAQAEAELAETLDRATPAHREDDEELTYEEMHFDGFPPDAQILHITYERTEPRAENTKLARKPSLCRKLLNTAYRLGEWMEKKPNGVQIAVYYFLIPMLAFAFIAESAHHLLRYGDYISAYVGSGFDLVPAQVALEVHDERNGLSSVGGRLFIGALGGLGIGLMICVYGWLEDDWPHQ